MGKTYKRGQESSKADKMMDRKQMQKMAGKKMPMMQPPRKGPKGK